ncbi:plasmid mobilization protein [Niabella insulamsoli]|uniref:plasmid mobilization protein n=1 Tax=Niabella insulamsoli TaxID=3144874 RepID=UPI0031FBAC32
MRGGNIMNNNNHKNKGGRPSKTIKRNYRLRVACSAIEVTVIKSKARNVQLTVSEFLREAALKSQIVSRQKTLPKEVLTFTARLNHLAANINSMAYKNNRLEDFSLLERATFKSLAGQVKELAQQIKNYIS